MPLRDTRLINNRPFELYILSSDYRPTRFILSDDNRTNAFVKITENTTNGTIGNNDGLEFTGDAIVNFGLLNVIMEHLRSVKGPLGYDDSKLYACAAVSRVPAPRCSPTFDIASLRLPSSSMGS